MHAYDVHIHTKETSICSIEKARTLVRLYKRAGFSGIVITDHYYKDFFDSLEHETWENKIDCFLAGYRVALNEGRKSGINVLLGAEMRFIENNNDYLVYGIDENFLYTHKRIYDMNIKSFMELISNMPVLVYQAHPYRAGSSPANTNFLHGIEVFNGHPRHENHNEKAFVLAEKNNLKMLSGSDCHRAEDVGRGGIILPEAPETSFELAEMLRHDKIIKLLGM